MTTEELVREIVSKICPLDGKRAIVSIQEAGQIKLSACCKEFQAFLEHLIKNEVRGKANDTGSS